MFWRRADSTRKLRESEKIGYVVISTFALVSGSTLFYERKINGELKHSSKSPNVDERDHA